MEEDTKSDVSEIQSQRTGSVLSGRDESDTGAQDAADVPSDSQPGTYYKSLSFKTAILRTRLRYISFNISSEKLVLYQGQFSPKKDGEDKCRLRRNSCDTLHVKCCL